LRGGRGLEVRQRFCGVAGFNDVEARLSENFDPQHPNEIFVFYN
jgi:hypothetical protein